MGNGQWLSTYYYSFSGVQKFADARVLNLKPLFPCTLSEENSSYALINQCFIVIQQALVRIVLLDSRTTNYQLPTNN